MECSIKNAIIALVKETTIFGDAKMKQKNVCRAIWTAALLLALGMVVFGYVSGEAETVFSKAVNICMECIGLG